MNEKISALVNEAMTLKDQLAHTLEMLKALDDYEVEIAKRAVMLSTGINNPLSSTQQVLESLDELESCHNSIYEINKWILDRYANALKITKSLEKFWASFDGTE